MACWLPTPTKPAMSLYYWQRLSPPEHVVCEALNTSALHFCAELLAGNESLGDVMRNASLISVPAPNTT
jgi:hypothetical protein